MKRSMVCLILCTAAAVGVSGCALPYESEHPTLAGMQPHHHRNNLPPAAMLMHPGPGVDGPGPGVLMAGHHAPMAGPGMIGMVGLPMQSSQIAFIGPDGMYVQWDVTGNGNFEGEALIAPGRYNFPQGAIYRIKLTHLAGRQGVELYPTLEVGPATPRTEAFLAHNAIPFQLTEEDLDQVLSGNFVTKVIYLPDPEFQELALAGVATLVSTRLDPGVDPITEADRRGSIMAIIRIGNKDLQAPGVGQGGGQVIRAGYTDDGGLVQQAGFHHHYKGDDIGPYAVVPGMPSAYIAGITSPDYGMPITGTPIGLPGPPHVPLGVPAGLRQHRIVNHTHMDIPPPTDHVEVDVKQHPGQSYPKPANKVKIVEKQHTMWPWIYHQPLADKHEHVPGASRIPRQDCPEDECQ